MMFCIDSLKHHYFKPLIEKFDSVYCTLESDGVYWRVDNNIVLKQYSNNTWYNANYLDLNFFSLGDEKWLKTYLLNYFNFNTKLTSFEFLDAALNYYKYQITLDSVFSALRSIGLNNV